MTDYIVVENNNTSTVVDNNSSTIITEVNAITNVIEVNNVETVIDRNEISRIITIGTQGPAGPPGPAGDEVVMYSKRVDFINDNLLYRGEAIPGALESNAVWRIRKITISAVDDDVVETWADGTDAFTKVWDNRLGYTYS